LQRLGCEVCFWSRDFQMGRVILDEIRAASFACKYAIVLLTPDDRMSGRPSRWLPRGNVLFELGYFLNALGTTRTLVVAQKGVEIPADYSGYIYTQFSGPKDLSAVNRKLKEALAQDIGPSISTRGALVFRGR